MSCLDVVRLASTLQHMWIEVNLRTSKQSLNILQISVKYYRIPTLSRRKNNNHYVKNGL